MIKKTTVTNFKDGDYAGQYDWQGGIPLTVGEVINVTLDDKQLVYRLVDKKTNLVVGDDDQTVTTNYSFELSE